MKLILSLIIVLATVTGLACTQGETARNNVVPGAPAPEPKDGDYLGDGTITKINMQLGSVEMDHGEIPGLMPAMRMEFYVSDKAFLDGLAVGDRIDFTILYKGGTETITKITKKHP